MGGEPTGYTPPRPGAGIPREEGAPVTFQGTDLSTNKIQWNTTGVVRNWRATWSTPLMYSWPWFGEVNRARPVRAESSGLMFNLVSADLFTPTRDWSGFLYFQVANRNDTELCRFDNALFPADWSEMLRATQGYLGLLEAPAWKFWRVVLDLYHVSVNPDTPDHQPFDVRAVLVPWGARR